MAPSAAPWDDVAYVRPLPNPFKIEPNNAYGRSMIEAQQRTHDRLIERAAAMTECHMSKMALRQLQFRQMSQNWRISPGELLRRQMDDALLADLITNSVSQLDCKIDAHVLSFKEHRMRHPNHKPGWLELQEQQKHYQRHQEIVKGDNVLIRVDNQPPSVALRYRHFLQSSRFTKGGVPRTVPKPKVKPRPTHGRRKKSRAMMSMGDSLAHLLPPRRRQAASVMGVAGEPPVVAPPRSPFTYTSSYDVHEIALDGNQAKTTTSSVKFPPIGGRRNSHSASSRRSERGAASGVSECEEYEEEFEDFDGG